ncbi:MAG: hypothetical protein ACREON_08205 [Gemmatimonadaceae bacterium]
MSTRTVVLLSTIATAATLAGCRARDAAVSDSAAAAVADSATTASMPNVVTITARDYEFDAPAQVPAGLTRIRLVNQGPELHHVQLVKLNDGKTMSDLEAVLSALPQGPPPAWMEEMGGPNTPAPGKESNATLNLEPGNYAILCWIPSPDGKPHIAKGMVRPLTVTESSSSVMVAEPTADVTMRLTDYDFEMSQPLTAGTHTIKVENAGEQPHEVVFIRMAPGKKAADLVAWVDKPTGPPPGEPLGGTTGFKKDSHQYVTIDFTPGNYALICFVPDAKDGKPHFVHGMMKDVTIGA